MRTILKTAFNFIGKKPDNSDESAKRFLAKSENFRPLLTANNAALERMAEMTEESRSDRIFGMAHVRAQSLKVAAAVRQMIERLCSMKLGTYETLKDVFNRIVLEMEKSIIDKPEQASGSLVMGMKNIRSDSITETGSKVALLGEIRAALNLRVPQGFSITASAFHLFMEQSGLDDEINRLTQITDSHELKELLGLEKHIRHAIDLAAMPPEIEDQIEAQCVKLLAGNKAVRLAVRSSALGEDSEDSSFAGQFLSLLGVPPAEVVEAYRSIVASMYSATAMTYRLNRGLREDGMAMCVGCMEMIDAVAGGVVYTHNPMGIDDNTLNIHAVPGLPISLVDGSNFADSWMLNRTTLFADTINISTKKVRHVLTQGGNIIEELLPDDEKDTPCITKNVVEQLAQIGLRIENHFGHPQDIEWALTHDGKIYILQCRPLSICEVQASIKTLTDEDTDAPFTILSSAIPASPGVATGHVVMVETDADMLHFPDGGILLARNARPQLSALLPRASALIAEYGSSAGHLANVAREFSIPALIGAPGAIERLSAVSVVTVNANTGTVYLGKRQSVLDTVSAANAAPRENDVRTAMKRVLSFIVPLSLTNPDSPDFSPEACRSLHDITRFCHEKAVSEMFRDGTRPVANARKLVGKLPMQYWLVDIGGGTEDSGNDTLVGLDDIRSNAMLTLWHGMSAIRWEGPPPVNMGGFISIISEAAQNPALAPGMANDMGERNYFTVGTHYCNLQSRFGFHFCTIEGFAGSDPNENYALFQFKGGGADMHRRQGRTALIGEVLECHGFIVEIRDDALFARMEGVAKKAIEQALAVAGYLLMHTRQIDMVMTDQAARDQYREKFRQDIDVILSTLPATAHTRRHEA